MPETKNVSGDEENSPENSNFFGKYEFGKLIGCGAFAKVYHARNIQTGQSVAIKAVSKQKITKGGLTAQLKREISIMRRLRNPNIVKLYEVLATKTKIYFVMEFAKGGELFSKIAKGRFSEDLSRRYFQQLISAVGYCHSRGVFHRDLKPENLLLDENWELKVSDFGLSAVTDPTRPDSLLHTLCGTPAYVAPEILEKKGYNGARVDVWSCGIILYVLIAGYLPFNDPNLMAMYRKIHKGEFRCPKWTSPDLKRFISRLLDTNPDTRITIDEILRDSWFKKGYNEVKFHHDDNFDHDLKEFKENQNEKQLNAFDIISFSSGFDLRGLFTESNVFARRERFVSHESPDKIIKKIKEVAKNNDDDMVVVKKKDWGVALEDGRGRFVIVIEIYRLTDDLVVVEVKENEIDVESSYKIWKHKFKPQLSALIYHSKTVVVSDFSEREL